MFWNKTFLFLSVIHCGTLYYTCIRARTATTLAFRTLFDHLSCIRTRTATTLTVRLVWSSYLFESYDCDDLGCRALLDHPTCMRAKTVGRCSIILPVWGPGLRQLWLPGVVWSSWGVCADVWCPGPTPGSSSAACTAWQTGTAHQTLKHAATFQHMQPRVNTILYYLLSLNTKFIKILYNRISKPQSLWD